MTNRYSYEIPYLELEDMFKAYAEVKNQEITFVRGQYATGEITNFNLFDAYLRYNGIIGYSMYIATAARICFAEEWS